MNPTGSDSQHEGQLDRLVDGELNETDRHELLLQFEREPEGWRRCALAFLEAQCWKQELGLVRRTPDAAVAQAPAMPADPATVRKVTSDGRAVWRQRLATVLTMGACFLIALAIGLNVRGINGPHNKDNSNVAATNQTEPLNGPAQPTETLTIDNANGETESLSVPRVRHSVPGQNNGPGQNIADQGPDAIPRAVQKELQRTGHEIVQEHQDVPVHLNNGRQFVVPVDHVQIHYVGRGSL
jgi:hypothetical protein